MSPTTRLLALCAASALWTVGCSDTGPSSQAGGDAAPLPVQGRAFVESSLEAEPTAAPEPTTEVVAMGAAPTDAAPTDTAPSLTERIEDAAYEAASAALADAPNGIESALEEPEAFAAEVAGEVAEEFNGVLAAADGAGSDLEAGSLAPPDTLDPPAGLSTEHSGYQPLPRAFETDQLDEATGVPVLERDGGDILVMSFEDLSYPDYIPRDPLAEGDGELEPHAFPQRLTKFDGRRATIDGFMIPTSFRDGKVREFILSGDPPYCCFGGFPPIDRAIDITLPEDHPGVEYSSYGVFRVIGTLAVGETFDEYGYVLGIYQLHAETVAEEF